MEWAEEFYSKQAAWSGIYTSDVSDYHRGKASLLQALAGDSPKTVLELGAGGGQAAFATAELGYHVTAIELLPTSAAHAMSLSTRTRRGSLRVVQGDFYAVQADGPYDIVCYWDGFGIGPRRGPSGAVATHGALVESVGRGVIGHLFPLVLGEGCRPSNGIRHGDETVWIRPRGKSDDSWWPVGREEDRVAQSLRCYSPADLKLLLRGTGLRLVEDATVPGGSVDYDRGTYEEHVELSQCMSYTVKLVPA